MKKFLLIISILIFSLVLAILFNPGSAEGSRTEIVRLDAKDIKQVFYERINKTVSLILQREIKDITRLDFINFNKSEALLLMDMLTSQKGLIVNVDIDSGYVYDFGFNNKAKWD
jgi:hypothetical protein